MSADSPPWDQLLPPGVVVEVAQPTEGEPAVFPEEERCVAQAVPERKRQFRTGRRCARRALARLGTAPTPLLPGPDRAPQWPRGVVGALSHTSRLCAVAAASADRFVGLGLDLEEGFALPKAEWSIVCTERELRTLQQAPDPGALAMTLFVIKECVYKCCRPRPGALLDFHSVEVTIGPQEFSAELRDDARADLPRGTVLRGRHARWQGHTIAAVALAQSDIASRNPRSG